MELENKVSEQINDIKKENLEKLAQLFPSIIKDGQVDFKALKEELGEFEEVKEERYEFTWAGKQNAKKKVQEDVGARTLKYIEEDSKNPDTTENLYIEGDNLEVLKLLRQNYYGSIKMIYIDPPYNTGKDFIYNDNFKITDEESFKTQGYISKENERLEKNTKDNNRFHAKWLNEMYPRLKIARDLLTEDGIIFISIDDNEQENLKKICNEIFGENNFLGEYIKQSKVGGGNDSKFIVKEHEFCLCYSRNIKNTASMKIKHEIEYLRRYKEEDENGRYFWDTFARPGLKNPIIYEIEAPDGTKIKNGWIRSKERFEREYREGKIKIIRKNSGEWSVQFKQYLNEEGKTPRSMTMDFGGTTDGDKDLKEIFEKKFFDYPKSKKFLTTLYSTINDKNMYILDFFSGSATTAHAVMQLNAEDGGNRKFIMVQLNELTYDGKKEKYIDDNGEERERYIIDKETGYPIVANDSEARKEGFYTICEIGKERIRRAGELIKKEIEESNRQLQLGEEPKKVPDIGFKVFRTADTNINWKKIREVSKDNVMKFDDPDMLDFTLGFNDKDVVYEVLLRQRDLPLSEKLVTLTDIGSRTYLYADSYLVCLETNVTEELIEKLAELNPLPIKFIFRDSAFGSKIGLKEETFRKLKTLVEKNSGLTKKAYTVEFI